MYRPQLVETRPMPVSDGRVDGAALHAWLAHHLPDLVVLEQVSSAPRQGVASTFAFGHGAGVIDGVLAVGGWRVLRLLPAVWKQAYRLPGGAAGKAQSVAMCAELVGTRLPEGEAEAVLIGWCGVKRAASVC